MFDTLGERLNKALDGVRGSGKLTEDQVKKVTREIRLALLEADVNYAVVKEFVSNVRERATGAEVSKALSPGQQVVKIVDEELANLMGGTAHKLSFASRPPTVVMLAGLTATARRRRPGNSRCSCGSSGRTRIWSRATLTGRPLSSSCSRSDASSRSLCTRRVRGRSQKRSPSAASGRPETAGTTLSSSTRPAGR